MRRSAILLLLVLLLSAPAPVSMSQAAAPSAAEPSPVRLTSGGCCTQPFWSPDGKQVRYIDRPPGSKLGIYGVDVDDVKKGSRLISERIEDWGIVGDFRVETSGSTTTLVRLSDGKQWRVPAQGRNVLFSPDFTRIAWSITDDTLAPERQVAAIWVAAVDGSGAKRVASVRRGSLSGWISGDALLVTGQDPKSTGEQVLWSLALASGQLTELARAERLRSAVLSPSGRWVVYYTTFDSDGGNGLWLASTSGDRPRALPRNAFGAYQWRKVGGADRLLIVPFRPEARYHELWQLDPRTLAMIPLTSANETPFKIANGDWRVSPRGDYIAYVESRDRNIWVLELP